MGTLQSWRKAFGALKDSTKVGLAKVNSEFKDLDIAIVKATNHDECPPKERHVRKIFAATSMLRPRADVAYCLHALSKRLAKTRNWIVALKTLIVIHRMLREGDPTFREELLNYSHRGRILQLSNFKDDSSPLAWDCSAWVRTYALFLEERLECFRILKYDIEAERLKKSSSGPGTVQISHSRTRDLGNDDLLEQLPALQQLLYCLVGCQPEGAAFHSYLIQYALALYIAIGGQILTPISSGISRKKPFDSQTRRCFPFRVSKINSTDIIPRVEAYVPPQSNNEVAALHAATTDTVDLLDLDETNPNAFEIEESNAFALAIVPPDGSKPSESGGMLSDTSGWELALVTTASSNNSHLIESKLAGGFDKLLLDSLYDDAARRQQISGYGVETTAYPFDQLDPFSMSNNVMPPLNVQMAVMAQQQQHMMMVPQPYLPYQPYLPHQPHQPQQQLGSSNPFGDLA